MGGVNWPTPSQADVVFQAEKGALHDYERYGEPVGAEPEDSLAAVKDVANDSPDSVVFESTGFVRDRLEALNLVVGRTTSLAVIEKMLHRLAEDLELSDDGILAHPLGHEHVVTSERANLAIARPLG